MIVEATGVQSVVSAGLGHGQCANRQTVELHVHLAGPGVSYAQPA